MAADGIPAPHRRLRAAESGQVECPAVEPDRQQRRQIGPVRRCTAQPVDEERPLPGGALRRTLDRPGPRGGPDVHHPAADRQLLPGPGRQQRRQLGQGGGRRVRGWYGAGGGSSGVGGGGGGAGGGGAGAPPAAAGGGGPSDTAPPLFLGGAVWRFVTPPVTSPVSCSRRVPSPRATGARPASHGVP